MDTFEEINKEYLDSLIEDARVKLCYQPKSIGKRTIEKAVLVAYKFGLEEGSDNKQISK